MLRRFIFINVFVTTECVFFVEEFDFIATRTDRHIYDKPRFKLLNESNFKHTINRSHLSKYECQ